VTGFVLPMRMGLHHLHTGCSDWCPGVKGVRLYGARKGVRDVLVYGMRGCGTRADEGSGPTVRVGRLCGWRWCDFECVVQ
jgi:hypothetical protein